jgi:hypothetical protein
MEIRCCCTPENLLGELPKGLPYPIRELDDGSFAYVAHSLPDEVLAQADIHRRGKGRSKSWANSPKKRKPKKRRK